MTDEKLLELWKEYKLGALEKATHSDLMQTIAKKSFYSNSEEAAQELTRKAVQRQNLLQTILVDQINSVTDYWGVLTPIFVEPQKPEIEPLRLISLPALKSPEISSLQSYSKKPILPNITYEDMERHEGQLRSTEEQKDHLVVDFIKNHKILSLAIAAIILIILLSGS